MGYDGCRYTPIHNPGLVFFDLHSDALDCTIIQRACGVDIYNNETDTKNKCRQYKATKSVLFLLEKTVKGYNCEHCALLIQLDRGGDLLCVPRRDYSGIP